MPPTAPPAAACGDGAGGAARLRTGLHRAAPPARYLRRPRPPPRSGDRPCPHTRRPPPPPPSSAAARSSSRWRRSPTAARASPRARGRPPTRGGAGSSCSWPGAVPGDRVPRPGHQAEEELRRGPPPGAPGAQPAPHRAAVRVLRRLRRVQVAARRVPGPARDEARGRRRRAPATPGSTWAPPMSAPPWAPTATTARAGCTSTGTRWSSSFSAQRWLTDWEVASAETFETDFARSGSTCRAGSTRSWTSRRATSRASGAPGSSTGSGRLRRRTTGSRGTPASTRASSASWASARRPHTDDRMVNLVTSGRDEERMAAFAAFLQAEFPEVTTLVNTVNEGVAQTLVRRRPTSSSGRGPSATGSATTPTRSPRTPFFQTNTVMGRAALRRRPRVRAPEADGHGLRPLLRGRDDLALRRRRGREGGRRRARRGGGRERPARAPRPTGSRTARSWPATCWSCSSPNWSRSTAAPTSSSWTPPRAGLHPKVVGQIAHLRPERIVYVSCNPQSQARRPPLPPGGGRVHR